MVQFDGCLYVSEVIGAVIFSLLHTKYEIPQEKLAKVSSFYAESHFEWVVWVCWSSALLTVVHRILIMVTVPHFF